MIIFQNMDNMKTSRLTAFGLCFSLALFAAQTFAQCEPDFDFGDADYGAFPDASLGEQFDTAYVGTPYVDVFHVLVPEDASAIEPTINFPLDSVVLVAATLVDTVTQEEYELSDVGLEIVCNNNGTSSNPCTLIAPGQYCANLEGTPTQSGVYQMTLEVDAYVTVFGQAVGQPFDFQGYILDIKEGASSYITITIDPVKLFPNPASEEAFLAFPENENNPIEWKALDITGRTVTSGRVLSSGLHQFDVADWNAGVYFISGVLNGRTTTKRLIVQH